ncbi:FtsW/RodA/SpoVE family cell cycle protein [Carnobacterium divergens]|uniref:FtsW/RodA/SpoVE family cell cycle protein n=1 Tax=Carnobacterium divergens TaxID=2748 RepID=UPI0007F49AF2|nr:putative peptidoglycan glycosyltransferase FtsW [Carnobacterium divergens]TFJ44174.1 cell division protein FtsW [Carnobacterium divergens]TFJ50929.1 cell division protein FtsW [Carnobacterium divergens]SBO18122.1 Cell cycle family protein [Carnobacterium divergens]
MKKTNCFFLLVYFLLLCFGILMVYSASSDSAQSNTGSSITYFRNQGIYALIGIFSLFFVSRLKKSLLVHPSLLKGLLAGMFVLLGIVLLTGKINGASRWINIGFFNIQPVELAKIILIWYTAFILSKKQKQLTENWVQVVWAPLIVLSLVGMLLFLQPDTGSVLILAGIVLVQVFASGIPFYLGLLSSLFITSVLSGYIFLVSRYGTSVIGMSSYRFDRFKAFWSPFELENGAGHQLVNSYYALDRGGLLGVGLGKSVQKTGYLPEPHTDFILAVIGEELGLLGIIMILTLLFSLILWIFYLGIILKDPFASLLCIGVGMMFLIQSCINIGGVTGWLPISGVTLPFVSYGGSSLIISSLAIGLILNVSDTFRQVTD